MGSEFSDQDRWLFNAGQHYNLHHVLGAHLGEEATSFRVWAPNARAVSVIGDFNGWDSSQHTMHPSEAGVWEVSVPGVGQGTKYKYSIKAGRGNHLLDKADPVAFHAEVRPGTASIVWGLDYEWNDSDWMTTRGSRNNVDAPISIYECHLGSWSHQGPPDYVSMAKGLADHLERTGFTHIELLPIMEHPFDGSWGYQSTGYFAPTSRFGTPQQFMEFVDILHQRGIGVILDWVPSHFAVDGHGLGRFDGTHLYEHADPRQGYHPDWGSFVFNYGRNEVRSFLLSSAHYWFEKYHIDGLRVDAVASLLYLDYSRKDGEWIPNKHGGRENLEAVEFLQHLNASVYDRFPGVQVIAEESTAWPGVTRPTSLGGLGFGLKWDMGWMNDTLRYFTLDPIYRSFQDNHRLLTFRSLYGFSENFVLALSHDEVVHGKRSLLGRIPGDEWRRFAGLRSLLGYQWSLPGKKLLFMGGEIANPWEWSHESELPFHLLEYPFHRGMMEWVSALNSLYRSAPALHVDDTRPKGFAWVVADDAKQSTLAFLRFAEGDSPVLVAANFTPVERHDFRMGVSEPGEWSSVLCSDEDRFGGSGLVPAAVKAEKKKSHGFEWSIQTVLPPMSITYFRRV